MTLNYRGAVYEISVGNPAGVSRGVVEVEVDGERQPATDGKARIGLRGDGSHTLAVMLG